jgi:hypothetical protein
VIVTVTCQGTAHSGGHDHQEDGRGDHDLGEGEAALVAGPAPPSGHAVAVPDALAPRSVTAGQLRSTRLLPGAPLRVGAGGSVWSRTIVSVMTAVLAVPLQSVKRPQTRLVPSPAATDPPLDRAP